MSATRHDLTLDVFERKSGKLIKQVPLSNRPNNIAVAKDGRIVVGIARGEGALDIVDPATLTLKKTIPVHGRLHNVYVTPDSKYVITGSIRESTAHRHRSRDRAGRLGAQAERRRPADGDRGQPGRLDQARSSRSSPTSTASRWSISPTARRPPASSCRSPTTRLRNRSPGATTSPSHGIGVTPDNKTLWVTSIPNNAVFVYSLDDLKMVGQVALPALKLPGHERDLGGGQLGHLHAGLQDDLRVERRIPFGDRDRRRRHEGEGRRPVGEVPKRINTLVMPRRLER